MSTKLLIDEPPLQVLPSLACKIGLNEAIILQQIHYLCLYTRNEAQGRKWIYGSYQEITERYFPFWSVPTVVRTVQRLEALGLLISRQGLNRMGIDRTKWYTIDYEALRRLEGDGYASSEYSDEIAL
jgi:hypothetical protein